MKQKELLRELRLGSSVAEYDQNLSNYFVTTSYVEDFVMDRYDIVRGAKGSGKSAILIAITDNQANFEQLESIILLKASNISGDPDFKRAFDKVDSTNRIQDLVDAWKIYLINIVWDKIKEHAEDYNELEEYLNKKKLVSNEPRFLNKILYSLKRAKIKFSNTIMPDGNTVQSMEIFPDIAKPGDTTDELYIDYNYIFDEVNSILSRCNIKIWILMDRLDDAFPDRNKKTKLALKSLLYAYKDICAYRNFKLKIFIRDDIFSFITEKGFTSLTHVSSKTMEPITWDKESFEQLLATRLYNIELYREYLKLKGIEQDLSKCENCKLVIYSLLKRQVDTGKNPDSVGWMINHLKDGFYNYTPRDFLNLIDKARQIQIKKIDDVIIDQDKEYLIDSASIKEAFIAVSKDKIETQLFAEYPDYRKFIELFENSKAEHNEDSIKSVLGAQWKSRLQKLISIGFIEERKSTWKIPFLYRAGLNIKGGKAYS